MRLHFNTFMLKWTVELWLSFKADSGYVAGFDIKIYCHCLIGSPIEPPSLSGLFRVSGVQSSNPIPTLSQVCEC